jgi:hypothetical protein
MARKLNKTKAPTMAEQLLYVQFCFLCYCIGQFTEMIVLGSKFGYGAIQPIWVTYKKSGERTKWVYIFPQDKCIHNIHNMYFWSVTIESQRTIIKELRVYLQHLRSNDQWLETRRNNIQKKQENIRKLIKWRKERQQNDKK